MVEQQHITSEAADLSALEGLRQRAQEIADAAGAQMPPSDAGIVEAERRWRALRPIWEEMWAALDALPRETAEIDETCFNAFSDLEDLIDDRAPLSLAGAAAKLRRLLRLFEERPPAQALEYVVDDWIVASLRQILGLLEAEAGDVARRKAEGARV